MKIRQPKFNIGDKLVIANPYGHNRTATVVIKTIRISISKRKTTISYSFIDSSYRLYEEDLEKLMEGANEICK